MSTDQTEAGINNSNDMTLASLSTALERIENQNVFLQQQMSLVNESSKKHSDEVKNIGIALQSELKRFQTGAGKHAMSTIFFRFLRDLIQHANQIDELLQPVDGETVSELEAAWRDSIAALQGNLDTILAVWGCVPVDINVGTDLFDPNIHIAADVIEDEGESDRIVEVLQRGWQINGQIIQQPQVIVSE